MRRAVERYRDKEPGYTVNSLSDRISAIHGWLDRETNEMLRKDREPKMYTDIANNVHSALLGLCSVGGPLREDISRLWALLQRAEFGKRL